MLQLMLRQDIPVQWREQGRDPMTTVEMKERVEILELQSVFIMRLVLVINDISVS